jgi:glycosyltransferase involved in cell wall biosynthesis
MKICLLGYRSNPYSGGQGIYIRHLGLALTEAGHTVEVISGPPYPELDPRIKLIKLPSLDLYASEDHIRAFKWRYLVSLTDLIEYVDTVFGGFPEPYTFGRRLVRYFNQHQPQYDIIHDNQSLCYGVLALQEKGYPVITTVHHPITRDLEIALADTTDWGMRLLIKRWHSFLTMQTKVIRQLHHLVTVSEAARRDIASAFGVDAQRIQVVHNGIDLNRFKPMPEITRASHRLMTTASADAPLKGVQYLLKALAEVAKVVPDITLCLLGKLKPGGETEALIDALNLRDRIEFHVDISDQEMVDLYARATIAIIPSVYEGFGFPAGEAMACGVPVISTRGGALPEVVGNCGVLVEPKDSQGLASAILDLLNRPDELERLASIGRQRIEQQFQWSRAAAEFLTLYQTVDGSSHVT